MNSEELRQSLRVRPFANRFNENRFSEIANNFRNPGIIEEMFGQMNQLNYIIKIPGEKTAGNHYHKQKAEWIMVLTGRLLVALKDPFSDSRYECIVPDGQSVYLQPRIAHAMTSLSHLKSVSYLEATTLAFNPDNPMNDVFPHEVLPS
jgi:dTDP-4-dehydrorhamnose 3,5-epimerase-like enzyme